MENTTLITQLKSQSTWKLFFLSLITLGIYTAHYIKRQSCILNEHLSDEDKLSQGFITFFLIYSYLSVILAIPYFFLEDGHPIGLISDAVDQIWNLLALILAFKVRNRINTLQSTSSEHENWLHGAGTFFFGFLYINFKINKLNEMIPNNNFHSIADSAGSE